MKKFRIGKIEITLNSDQLDALCHMMEVDGDQESVARLFIMFKEEGKEFNQSNVKTLIDKIVSRMR